MKRLYGAMLYLAGPIDNAKDDGVGWRRDLIAKTKHIGLKIIDPTNKPKKFKPEIGTEKQHLLQLKEEGRFAEVVEYVKGFRREDLRFVDISDGIIAYVDPDIHMCGTYDEIFTAECQRKPRMLIVKGGKKRCPNWLFGVFKLEDIFDSVDECVQRLNDIDVGTYKIGREWVLVRECIDGTDQTGIRSN